MVNSSPSGSSAQGFDGPSISSPVELTVIIVGARSHARSAISTKYRRQPAQAHGYYGRSTELDSRKAIRRFKPVKQQRQQPTALACSGSAEARKQRLQD